MPVTTLTSKGQVTVPKAIRDRLGLREGDKLEFTLDAKGRILVRPWREGPAWAGMLREYGGQRVRVEEMTEAVRRRAAEKARRSRR